MLNKQKKVTLGGTRTAEENLMEEIRINSILEIEKEVEEGDNSTTKFKKLNEIIK